MHHSMVNPHLLIPLEGVRPGSIRVEADFGASQLNMQLVGQGFAQTTELGTLKTSRSLRPNGISVPIGYGDLQLAQELIISPESLTVVPTFGLLKLAPDQFVNAQGFVQTSTFGINQLNRTIPVTGISANLAYGIASFKYNQSANLSGIAVTANFGTHLVDDNTNVERLGLATISLETSYFGRNVNADVLAASDQKKYTFAFWAMIGSFNNTAGGNYLVFNNSLAIAVNNTGSVFAQSINAENAIQASTIQSGNGVIKEDTKYFFHVVLDTTQPLAADRFKMFIGEYANTTPPAQPSWDTQDTRSDLTIPQNATRSLVKVSGNSVIIFSNLANFFFFDQVYGDIYFLDGVAEENSEVFAKDLGEGLKPVETPLSFGNWGFHYSFANVTNLPMDSSGNDWDLDIFVNLDGDNVVGGFL